MRVICEGFPGKMANGYMGWSSVVLVEQREKKILFDTGGIDKRVDLCPDLLAAGAHPEEIDYLVISHFHLDHIYNYDYFPNAEIILHSDELAYARKGEDPWQPHHLLAPVEKTGRLRCVRGGETLASGISVIHLPGHTPGCMGLVLEDPALPLTVLAGDAIKTIAEMATGKAPMTSAPEQTYASVKKVRSFARQVVPGHDRLLVLEKDRVMARVAARRTIIIPPDIVDRGKERRLELTLEQTWLPFCNGL
jgi:glyoxylase-like metal-dependent hydrolase (beta-lactamase superfamily II)